MTRYLKAVTLILIGIAFLPVPEKASQENCKRSYAAIIDASNRETPLVITTKDLRESPEKYYGKTVTVDGEMHWTFTNNVFTIEDKDRDFLIITTMPQAESVIPIEHSLDKGKKVRVTGVVQPYDRGKLECAYGPLHLESREGDSFTKEPVLIIDKLR